MWRILGQWIFFLCIKIIGNKVKSRHTLSQKLVEEILHNFDMIDCKSYLHTNDCTLQIIHNDSPRSIEEEQVNISLPFQQILASVRYLVSWTRPDLSCNVGFLSTFTQNPAIAHCQALKCVLWYLQHTNDISLTYQGSQSSNMSQFNRWMHGPLLAWTNLYLGGDILILHYLHLGWFSLL